MTQTNPRVAVIGGGITGLAAAHRLVELAPSIRLTLFEASDRLGGVLDTHRRDGFLVEGGADNFITTVPWALKLCQRIGFDDQLIPTNSQFRHAFVVRRGKMRPIPDGFVVMAPNRIWPIVTTPILSPLGKLRLACERFVATRRETDDETLASFCRRRLGRETYERLVQPLIGGIYTGDPEKLSLRATMSRFAEMEEKHGSLTRAMRAARPGKERSSGARYSMFVAPRDGMSSLVDALAARLPNDAIQFSSPVATLARIPTPRERGETPTSADSGWRIQRTGGAEADFDAVIVAASAAATASLLATVDNAIADELNTIHHATCAIASVGYRRSQIAHPLDGFGVVVPRVERRKILSASFSSVKYAGRAPEDHVLIRVFIGGDCQPELARLPDPELVDLAHAELNDLLGVQGEPVFTLVSRRGAAMPQYFVGHQEKVERVRRRLEAHPGLYLAGNAYDGVGVPYCVQSGERAAEALVEQLHGMERSLESGAAAKAET